MTASAQPLRPRSATELLDGAIRLARAHYGPLIVLGTVAALPSLLVLIVMPEPATVTISGEWLGWWAVLSVISYAWYGIAGGAMVHAALEAYRGRDISPAYSLRMAFRRAVALMLSTLIVVLIAGVPFFIMMAGMAVVAAVAPEAIQPSLIAQQSPSTTLAVIASIIALAIGLVTIAALLLWALYFLARYSAAIPAILLEGRGVLEALRRSSELTRQHRGRIIGLIALSLLIVLILMIPALFLGPLLAEELVGQNAGTMIGQVVSTVVGILVSPLLPAVYALLYYDLRIRKEGYDIELLAEGIGAPSGAPPAPTP